MILWPPSKPLMSEAAKLYRGVHRLLGQAKAAGWRISLTPGGAWRVTHPGGGGVTITPRPTALALLDAEAQLHRDERQHQSTTPMEENTT